MDIQHVSFIDLLDKKETKPKKKSHIRFTLWLKKKVSLIVWLIALLVFILGYIGYSKEYDNQYYVIYSVFQLFLIITPIDKIAASNYLVLDIAVGLAPLVTGYAGLSALVTIFHEKVSLFRVRISRNHVVVVGLGEKGMQLVTDFIANGDKVVVIELNENNEHHKTVELMGAIVIIGNSTDSNTLIKAKVHFASYIVVTTGSDKTNLKTTIQIYHIVTNKRSLIFTPSPTEKYSGIRKVYSSVRTKFAYRPEVICKVHLVNKSFLGLIQNHEIFTNTDDNFELSFFNTNIYTSRILFFDNPIESLVDTKSKEAPQLHLLIHRFNETAMGVVIQAVKLGNFANGKRIRFTILDENPAVQEQLFTGQYPQFNKIADFKFFKLNTQLKFNENNLKVNNKYEFPLSAIIICNDSDEKSLSDSLAYSRLIRKNDNKAKIPIFVQMKDNLDLSSSFINDTRYMESQYGEQFVFSFGNTDRVCTRELVITEKLDILAKSIHSKWRQDDSYPNWDELPTYLQDANRQQADHILVKLHTIDANVAKIKNNKINNSFTFSDDEIELLAQMEHLRWNTERFLNGWRYGEKRDRMKKITPHLVPFDELEDEIKEIDRESVRQIPKLLELLGFEIIRNKSI